MKKYIIKLDNKYISGMIESKIDIPINQNIGFHSSRNSSLDKIKLNVKIDNAIRIESLRNLKSWIDKIITRNEIGILNFKKISIEEIENGAI